MRRPLWMLSTSLVAGGLVWGVNAADPQVPRTSRASAAQSGRIFNFARNPRSEVDAPPTDPSEGAETVDDESPPVRYVRKRPGQGASPSKGTKNLYQELFGEAGATPERVAAGSRKAARSVEPASDDELRLAGSHAEEGDEGEEIEHAEHTTTTPHKGRHVQQVQQTGKVPPRRTAAESPMTTPPADEEEAEAPPAPPITRPVRQAPPRGSAAVARPGRPAPGSRPVGTKTPPVASRVAEAAKSLPAEEPAASEATTSTPVAGSTTSAVPNDISDVPLISLKWVKTGELNVGQKCQCSLVVRNVGKLPAKDVVVEAQFPRTVKVLDSQPAPNDSKELLAWLFDHLEPGAERTICVTMVPSRRGELATTATVRFTGVASHVLRVDEPQLAVAVAGPQEVMVGDTTTQLITVSNPGTGVARDVVVHAHLSEGIDHPRGKDVEMGVGSLGPGESREVRLPVSATAGGESTLRVEARGENLVQRAQAKITVAAPRLKIEAVGPSLRYVNRHAQYTITVTNEGVAATDNVRVVHVVPEGFEFVKADRGGKFEPATSAVGWFVGRVEAGQSVVVACDLTARRIGEYEHRFQTSGDNGSTAAAKLGSKIDSASAVVMEVADLDDPVEVETQTAYEIKIRNDGSKAAQALRLACELPAGVQLLGTEGPTDHGLEKGTLVFKPLAELAAGDRVTYRIKVQGKTAGNLRLRAKLTTNASTEPLVVEELTKFYAD